MHWFRQHEILDLCLPNEHLVALLLHSTVWRKIMNFCAFWISTMCAKECPSFSEGTEKSGSIAKVQVQLLTKVVSQSQCRIYEIS